MHRQASRRNYLLSLVVLSSLLLTTLPLPVFARERKPVIVSFGQPNIWSLEQAHYLLARMHMTNLELQAKALTAEELDPNVTHGNRVQIIRQLLTIGAQFDETVGFKNRRVVQQAQFNDNRRRELIARRDSRNDELLGLTREIRRLEIERARMDSDPTATPEAKALKDTEIEKAKEEQAAVREQVTQIDREMETLNSAAPSESPTAPDTSDAPFDKDKLPDSVLSRLSESDLRALLEPGKDPKLNATTMLDNTVQLQYEIIAKQLTLLRDEVGPGERLVFLELPQSIYTTPGNGDEKMAQSWWHVNGYTRVDPLVRLLLELFEVEQKWFDIRQIPAFVTRKPQVDRFNCDGIGDEETNRNMREDPILDLFIGLKCERENARRAVLSKLYREGNSLFSRVEQNGARNTSDLVEAIRRVIAVTEGKIELKTLATPGSDASQSAAQATDKDPLKDTEALKQLLFTILSEEQPMEPKKDSLAQTALETFKQKYAVKGGREFERGIEFIQLHEAELKNADIPRRTVRAVDIIPRQSSLNVNDIQNTVKATGILAGFKFLFGFAGQVNFQRQREQFTQFVHQELYASGFGKGSHDFGWTFGALPGTNRVAPGVRTTYAALLVPDDADSLVLSARGCYFPRKTYQPLDFEDTGHADWSREDRFKRSNCGDEQTYILPIPGGGNTSNFWVTNIDYQSGHNDGDFATVSVRGNNFSSQMGVLVNGVPLFPTVGLAHPHLLPRKSGANNTTQPPPSECNGEQTICGRYERVDPQQIVFSFRMPDGFAGIPTITLVAPGKSVDLNTIPNVRINRRSNVMLKNDADFMFGRRPPRISINNVELLNVGSPTGSVEALVSGRGFEASNDVYVNGIAATKDFRAENLYRITFNLPRDENLEIKITRPSEVATKVVPNPAALKIRNATVLSYDPPANRSRGVMTAKLDIVGVASRVALDGAAAGSSVVPGSTPREVIVRIINPAPTVVITIRDTATGGTASTAVKREPVEAVQP